MGAPSEFCSFIFRFNGLPEHMTIAASTGHGCLNDDDDDAKSTKVSIEVPASTEFFSNDLLAFSQVPSWSVSFPRMFFDRNGGIHEKNVKEFLAFFESCLLGLNISESSSTQDDSAKPVPHGSEDKNGNGDSGRKEELVHGFVKILRAPEKGVPKVSKGQNQQANNDVNKPIDVSLEQPEHLIAHTNPTNPQASNYLPINPTISPQQQGSNGGPSANISASQISKPSSESTQSDLHTSSEQAGAHVENSKMVTPLSTMDLAWKKKHTIHCFLHRSEDKCNLCDTPEECQNNYDEEFASQLEQFLDRDSQPSANNEDAYFFRYIEVHLQAKNCPSPCSRLWKYCIGNKLFHFLKYAPEGLLIHSNSRQDAVGTVIDTYLRYGNMNLNLIGSGGFGNVYEFPDERAVKEEFKQPLINGNAVLFQRIMELNHSHVIKVLEYITGPGITDSKCFLSVMPFKNQKDLQKQFKKEKHLTCVLDYMVEYQDQKKFIFRNYTVLFRHVFEGLCYLKSKGIVHRDIKPSNILIHQNCTCQSPLQCTCTGDGDVTYLLGDMDLLSLEEESANLTYTCDEWEKMAYRDPAGTIGMKPPESFFRNKKGDCVTTHKSDVWSACVTMMNVLINKTVNTEAQEEVTKFIAAATEGAKAALKSITDSLNLLETILAKFKSEMKDNSGLINETSGHLKKFKKLLTSGERSLHQSQSFQGGHSEVYKEENPLAGILTTAHGAQVLYWKCYSKVEDIYDAQLWNVMQQTMNAIVAGIKFVPESRQDATEILECLKAIPPVDCSDNGQRTFNN